MAQFVFVRIVCVTAARLPRAAREPDDGNRTERRTRGGPTVYLLRRLAACLPPAEPVLRRQRELRVRTLLLYWVRARLASFHHTDKMRSSIRNVPVL